MEFTGGLDCNPYNLKFTCDYNRHSVTFLDLTIMLNKVGHVRTKLYKNTAMNSLLHASSYHSKSLIKNIPTGQYLRARSNCTDQVDFEKEAKVLGGRFQDRGYNNK